MGSLPSGTAEDCLFLDVYAPTDARPDSKLPVFVWIQGGGFVSAGGHTNGSALIQAAGRNIITVSMTYRVGALGFLASKEVKNGGDLNLGLRDQRQALRWVQNNIRQFGGDPGHVTLGGQSAGAGSVLQHLVANNGANQGLFHAALMESQSMPPIRLYEAQQFQYDHLVKRAGCDGNPDTLNCLRGLPVETVLKSAVGEPWPESADGLQPVFSFNPVVDGDFVTDLPVKAFAEGRVVKVPTIFGSTLDEGTTFTPRAIKDAKAATAFIKANWPAITPAQLETVGRTYGFGEARGSEALYKPNTPYWRRPSMAYGETRYICAGQYLASMLRKKDNPAVWSYRYDVEDPDEVAKDNGVGHGAELPAVWGPINGGAPKSLFTDNKNIVPVVQGYWTSFIRTFDPNPGRAPGAPLWDRWTGNNPIRLTANDSGMDNVTDEFASRCKFWEGIAVDLMQ